MEDDTNNIDLYTKSVLTVIAGCLLWIVARDVALVPDARAQEGFAAAAEVKVDVVKVGGVRLGIGGTLPVKINEVDQMIRGSLPVSVQR